jgi:hypothetical protein
MFGNADSAAAIHYRLDTLNSTGTTGEIDAWDGDGVI